jgi:hypothetical protein
VRCSQALPHLHHSAQVRSLPPLRLELCIHFSVFLSIVTSCFGSTTVLLLLLVIASLSECTLSFEYWNVLHSCPQFRLTSFVRCFFVTKSSRFLAHLVPCCHSNYNDQVGQPRSTYPCSTLPRNLDPHCLLIHVSLSSNPLYQEACSQRNCSTGNYAHLCPDLLNRWRDIASWQNFHCAYHHMDYSVVSQFRCLPSNFVFSLTTSKLQPFHVNHH